MDTTATLQTLLLVCLVSAAAPLLTTMVGGHVPQVVLLLVGGVLIGPQVLGIAEPELVQLIAEVGLGFLFLIAGYEVEPRLLREPVATRAFAAWAASLVLALVVVGVLAAAGLVQAYVAVSLALTTTALGVLLPLLRDRGLLSTGFGDAVLTTGAVGEMLPVLAVAIFLGTRGSFVALLSLAAIALLAAVLAVVPRRFAGTALHRAFTQTQDDTRQSAVRATVLLLVLFLTIAAEFGLDAVLGAFLAGMVLRQLGPTDPEAFEHKLDAVGYGFFIPVFFVVSGMNLDIQSIADNPLRLVLFFTLLLVVRGVPTVIAYRGMLPLRDRVELGVLAATALPLLVAITQIGLANGTMLPENAAALVGAGALSVLLFPALALASHARHAEVGEMATSGGRNGDPP
jgi:Kef-type K+ transport system membrane component KefB